MDYLYQYTCEECNQIFMAPSPRRFCSIACKQKNTVALQGNNRNRVCRTCGKPFEAQVVAQLYCTIECRQSYTKHKGFDKDKDKNLAKILLHLDVDEFCRNFIIHHWQRGDEAEKRRLEGLNPDIDFKSL